MIAPPEIRQAKAVLAKHRKLVRKARAARVMPEAANAVQRKPRERDNGYLAWLRRQPCSVAFLGGCSGPIEAAHVRYSDLAHGVVNPGMQRKPSDRYAVSLCAGHHRTGPNAQHRTSELAWWKAAGIDAYALAAELHKRYRGVG